MNYQKYGNPIKQEKEGIAVAIGIGIISAILVGVAVYYYMPAMNSWILLIPIFFGVGSIRSVQRILK